MKRKLIPNLAINNGEISCKDRTGKYQPLLKLQGDLDGACATYCVVMNLLVLQLIYNSDTRVGSSPRDAETKHLIRKFFKNYGMHRNGQTYTKIRKMLLESFGKKVVCTHYASNDELKTLDTIESTIKSKIPAIISVSFKGGGAHALLAVGYEKEGDDIKSILCLDPSGQRVGNRRWNATIELHFDGRATYRHNYEGQKVSLDDILVIDRK